MVRASAGVMEAMADWEMSLLIRQTFQSVWQTSAALQKFRLGLITPVPASRTIRSGVGDMGVITGLATVTSMIETSPSKLDNESFSFVSCRWKAVVSSNDVICWAGTIMDSSAPPIFSTGWRLSRPGNDDSLPSNFPEGEYRAPTNSSQVRHPTAWLFKISWRFSCWWNC